MDKTPSNSIVVPKIPSKPVGFNPIPPDLLGSQIDNEDSNTQIENPASSSNNIKYQIKQAQIHLETCKKNNEDLQEQLKALESLLEIKEKEVSFIQTEFNHYTSRINEVSDDYFYNLVPDHEIKQTELKLRKDEYEHVVAKLTAAKFKVNSRKSNIEKYEKELFDKENQLKVLKDQLKVIESETQSINQDLYEIDKHSDTSRIQYNYYLQEIKKNDNEIYEINNQIEDLVQEISSLDKKIKLSRVFLDNSRNKYAVAKKKIDDSYNRDPELSQEYTHSQDKELYRGDADTNFIQNQLIYQQKPENLIETSEYFIESPKDKRKELEIQKLKLEKEKKIKELYQVKQAYKESEMKHKNAIEIQKRKSQKENIWKGFMISILIVIILYKYNYAYILHNSIIHK